MSAINAGFVLAGGDQLGTSSYLWSSSEYDSSRAWYLGFSDVNGLGSLNSVKIDSYEVRPVLEF